MKDDPAIQRIHDARNTVSERIDHDSKKLVAYYIEGQKKPAEKALTNEKVESLK